MLNKLTKKTMPITIRELNRDIVAGMDLRASKQGISRQQLLHFILTQEFLDDMQAVLEAKLRIKN